MIENEIAMRKVTVMAADNLVIPTLLPSHNVKCLSL
jgi:hypothetical protein